MEGNFRKLNARPSLPVNPNPNPTPSNLGVTGLNDTAACHWQYFCLFISQSFRVGQHCIFSNKSIWSEKAGAQLQLCKEGIQLTYLYQQKYSKFFLIVSLNGLKYTNQYCVYYHIALNFVSMSYFDNIKTSERPHTMCKFPL